MKRRASPRGVADITLESLSGGDRRSCPARRQNRRSYRNTPLSTPAIVEPTDIRLDAVAHVATRRCVRMEAWVTDGGVGGLPHWAHFT